MSFRDHIVACNNYDPARTVPFFARGERVGLLRRDNAAVLRRFSDVFAVADDKVILVADGDVAAISRAVDRVVDALVAEGRVRSGATRPSMLPPAGAPRRCSAWTAAPCRFSGRGPTVSI